MKQIRYLLIAVFMMSSVQVAHASAPLSDAEMANCDVLMGRAKMGAFDATLRSARTAAASGTVEDVMRYGFILHNKMACINEESTNSTEWGSMLFNEDESKVEVVRPPAADPFDTPELAATLREAVRTFEQVAETEPDARILLGKYYSDYHAFLQKPGKGYVYVAGVYSAECRQANQRRVGSINRCTSLRHDRIVYDSLLPFAQRDRLDVQARAWGDRHLARMRKI